MSVEQYGDLRVLLLPEDGPLIAAPNGPLDLIGDAFGAEAEMVVVPVSRLAPEFFQLSSGLAGEVLQKCVNYHVRLVVLGDVSAYEETSDSFRDLVRESNAGRHAWFLPGLDALKDRLGLSALGEG